MATQYRTETIFTWGAPPLKFGVGALDEIGFDLGQMGLSRVLIVTDEGVAATGIPLRAAESMQNAGLKPTLFTGVHVEPTDQSLREAVDFARDIDWDGFVAIGGGSSIDTAKAINLLTTNPGDLMDYVNKPVGGGKAPTAAAEAAGRGADDGGDWRGEHRDVHPRRAGAAASRPASATRGCARCWPWSTR